MLLPDDEQAMSLNHIGTELVNSIASCVNLEGEKERRKEDIEGGREEREKKEFVKERR